MSVHWASWEPEINKPVTHWKPSYPFRSASMKPTSVQWDVYAKDKVDITTLILSASAQWHFGSTIVPIVPLTYFDGSWADIESNRCLNQVLDGHFYRGGVNLGNSVLLPNTGWSIEIALSEPLIPRSTVRVILMIKGQ